MLYVSNKASIHVLVPCGLSLKYSSLAFPQSYWGSKHEWYGYMNYGTPLEIRDLDTKATQQNRSQVSRDVL